MPGYTTNRRETRRPIGQNTRVSLDMAVRDDRYFRLYLVEWLAKQRCNGLKALGAAIPAGGIVWLMLRDPGFAENTAPVVMIGLMAVPIVFGTYALLAIAFPQILFRLNHSERMLRRARESHRADG